MMIQVINKALRILEYISEEPDTPRRLNEIAKKIGITAPSCSYIVKTLLQNSYLEQVSAKGGYILGPMAYQLPRNGIYRKDIITAAKPVLNKLVNKINETALVSIFHNLKVFIICIAESSHDYQIRRNVLFQNSLYATATGRLLLAYLPELELERFISTCGLPGPVWPGADSKEKLLKELQSIRKKEMAMLFTASDLVFIAVPLRNGEAGIAALGVSMAKSDFTEDKKKLIPAEMKKAAGEISLNLSSRTALEGN